MVQFLLQVLLCNNAINLAARKLMQFLLAVLHDTITYGKIYLVIFNFVPTYKFSGIVN